MTSRRRVIRSGAWLLPFLAPLSFGAAPGREVVDASGRKVGLPAEVRRIAEGWAAHNTVLMMLGAADRISTTLIDPATKPWMTLVAPAMANALSTHGIAFNVEQLLQMKTDVVFLLKGDKTSERMISAGVPAVEITFNDHASMKACIVLTARVIGGDAPTRAERYNAYLDAQIRAISESTAAIPSARRPSVLHVASMKPFRVDGGRTIIDEWIRIAGGRNAAVGVESSLQEVTAEQVLSWDPDVIIVSATAAVEPLKPQVWSSLRAVRSGSVLTNPEGVFPWDRYGTEAALQLPWAAKTLHPELFSAIDMNAQTRAFYQQFFDYPLGSGQAARILAGLRPA